MLDDAQGQGIGGDRDERHQRQRRERAGMAQQARRRVLGGAILIGRVDEKDQRGGGGQQ